MTALYQKQVGDGVFIISKVPAIGVLQALMDGFNLDEDQREAVDKTEQIRAALVQIPDTQNWRQEEIVVGWLAQSTR